MKVITKSRGLLPVGLCICLVCGMFIIQGCGGGGDDSCSDCGDPEYQPRLAMIEGFAHFPFYENGPHPSYYDDGNYGIQIALHADDGSPIEIRITDESGYYCFEDVPEGYYFITAFIQEYDEYEDLYYIYEIESPDIDIYGGETVRVDLYLEYTGVT